MRKAPKGIGAGTGPGQGISSQSGRKVAPKPWPRNGLDSEIFASWISPPVDGKESFAGRLGRKRSFSEGQGPKGDSGGALPSSRFSQKTPRSLSLPEGMRSHYLSSKKFRKWITPLQTITDEGIGKRGPDLSLEGPWGISRGPGWGRPANASHSPAF